MRALGNVVRSALARRGYTRPEVPDTADVEPEFWADYERCRPFTMASMERCYALWKAARYVADRGVEGDFVECGVWRGGSAMIAALGLISRGDTRRGLHLFDTFAGMAPPTERDVSASGEVALETWAEQQRTGRNDWCFADADDVRRNMGATGYPGERLRLIAGRVEETIPGGAPESISLLRLDTDWYESTAHELRHLYPRLSSGGVLIVDDYGHWEGARQAVDEYFAHSGVPILLNRIDYTGRIAVRTD